MARLSPQWLLLLLALPAVSVSQSEKPQESRKTQKDSSVQGSAPVAEQPTEPTNPAQAIYAAADAACRERRFTVCVQLLEQVTNIEPGYRNSWSYLGWAYLRVERYAKAEAAFRQAIAHNPASLRDYNDLGQALWKQLKYEEAIAAFTKQLEFNSADIGARANIGNIYVRLQRFSDAIPHLEQAHALLPKDAFLALQLGRAYGRTGQPEKALSNFHLAVQLEPIPSRLNSAAFEMAQDEIALPEAQEYAERAMAATVLSLRDIAIANITTQDINLSALLPAYWDTYGWILFRQGRTAEAEKYVHCSWLANPDVEVGYHFGQILEKEGRQHDAELQYQKVLAVDAKPDSVLTLDGRRAATDGAANRLRDLASRHPLPADLTAEARQDFQEERTFLVANANGLAGVAEFWLLFSPPALVRAATFVSGDRELKPLTAEFPHTAFHELFPEATETSILRRGRLTCFSGAAACNLFLLPAEIVPLNEGENFVTTHDNQSPIRNININILDGTIKTQAAFIYPPAAIDAGVEGTVRLHVLVGEDGQIENIAVLDGPPLLIPAAVATFKKWIYNPTLVSGRPVKVERTAEITFSLNNSQKSISRPAGVELH